MSRDILLMQHTLYA